MEGELVPESIRGGWYLLPSEGELESSLEDDGEVLVFSLDGTFARYGLTEEGDREAEESGDYTFDGQFLILRAASTDTYRVHPDAVWRWRLEGKREEYLLLRGLTELEEPLELEEERVTEIESVPARVFVRSEFGGPTGGEICSFIHETDDGELRLGACYAESGEDGTWIGVSPFVREISDALWERIVRRSYLEIFRDDAIEDPRIEILR